MNTEENRPSKAHFTNKAKRPNELMQLNHRLAYAQVSDDSKLSSRRHARPRQRRLNSVSVGLCI